MSENILQYVIKEIYGPVNGPRQYVRCKDRHWIEENGERIDVDYETWINAMERDEDVYLRLQLQIPIDVWLEDKK